MTITSILVVIRDYSDYTHDHLGEAKYSTSYRHFHTNYSMDPRRHYTFQLESLSEIDFSRFAIDLFDLSNSNEFSETYVGLASNFKELYRNRLTSF